MSCSVAHLRFLFSIFVLLNYFYGLWFDWVRWINYFYEKNVGPIPATFFMSWQHCLALKLDKRQLLF